MPDTTGEYALPPEALALLHDPATAVIVAEQRASEVIEWPSTDPPVALAEGEYTPTTEEVRDAWRYARYSGADFDHWIADHDAAARAQGATEERARVVAWLNLRAAENDSLVMFRASALYRAAQLIAAGEHEATT